MHNLQQQAAEIEAKFDFDVVVNHHQKAGVVIDKAELIVQFRTAAQRVITAFDSNRNKFADLTDNTACGPGFSIGLSCGCDMVVKMYAILHCRYTA